MSGEGNGNGTGGEMHHCSEAKPSHQKDEKAAPERATTRSAQATPATRAARAIPKPEFDQRDRRPNPRRKASGPAQKRARKPAESATPSSTGQVSLAEVAAGKAADDTQ